MNLLLNRDLLLGRWMQCRARARQLWARLRRDALRDARGANDYLRGTVQARYGRNLAVAEWRLRRFERGL